MVGNKAKFFAIAAALGMVAIVMAWNPAGSIASAQNGGDGPPHPADKMAVAGSGVRFMSAATETVVTLFTTSIKTSSPTDLIFNLNAECALWTLVSVTGNGASESEARVKMWIEFDGKVVPVASDDTTDTGKVVFCDRVQGMEITDLDDEDARFTHYTRSRTANSFQWLTLDVGSGTHSVVVKAQLENRVTGDGQAEAGVGKRTLLVDPVKLANDATI